LGNFLDFSIQMVLIYYSTTEKGELMGDTGPIYPPCLDFTEVRILLSQLGQELAQEVLGAMVAVVWGHCFWKTKKGREDELTDPTGGRKARPYVSIVVDSKISSSIIKLY